MRFSIRHYLFVALLWAASVIQMHASELAKLPPLVPGKDSSAVSYTPGMWANISPKGAGGGSSRQR